METGPPLYRSIWKNHCLSVDVNLTWEPTHCSHRLMGY